MSKRVRIIPRLDVKGPNVVKGIQLEGLRVVGNPAEMAQRYYEQGADELLYMDIVASLYNRNSLTHIVEETVEKGVFIPITVGGGIRSLENIQSLLRSGADKVAINTAAVQNPNLLYEASRTFGSSTITLSIEAKRVGEGKWEAYTDNGRERTGLDVLEWAKQAQDLGVGEIMITSVDREGTKKGYDLELLAMISEIARVPVIISGGAGSMKDIEECVALDAVDGISVANLLHYKKLTISDIKNDMYQRYPERIHLPTEMKKNIRHAPEVNVALVDYGMCNLRSVRNTLEHLNVTVTETSHPDKLMQADCVILPGVGAFEGAMRTMKDKGLDQAIRAYAASGRPLLGICLGMQMLMTMSQEFGEHKGLNLIPGQVLPFAADKSKFPFGYKVPHVGWNKIISGEGRVSSPLLDSIQGEHAGYFVHSLYVRPDDVRHAVGLTQYFDYTFCSVVQNNNVFGCQFHPEKSGLFGLQLLMNFLTLGARNDEAQSCRDDEQFIQA